LLRPNAPRGQRPPRAKAARGSREGRPWLARRQRRVPAGARGSR